MPGKSGRGWADMEGSANIRLALGERGVVPSGGEGQKGKVKAFRKM